MHGRRRRNMQEKMTECDKKELIELGAGNETPDAWKEADWPTPQGHVDLFTLDAKSSGTGKVPSPSWYQRLLQETEVQLNKIPTPYKTFGQQCVHGCHATIGLAHSSQSRNKLNCCADSCGGRPTGSGNAYGGNPVTLDDAATGLDAGGWKMKTTLLCQWPRGIRPDDKSIHLLRVAPCSLEDSPLCATDVD